MTIGAVGPGTKASNGMARAAALGHTVSDSPGSGADGSGADGSSGADRPGAKRPGADGRGPAGLRARVRAEMVREIKDEARRQLAETGAPGLSLRAVARSLGMASSALYRYFPSRDDLLTALIVDGYSDLADAVEAADAGCGRDDHAGRWAAFCSTARTWAQEHPREYALVYGSPVPGYRAPDDTIAPAGRVTSVLTRVAADAAASGRLAAPWSAGPLPAAVEAEATRAGETALPGVPTDAVVRAIAVWTQVFGFISFELFGHFEGGVEDLDAIFGQVVVDMGRYIGLAA